MERPLLVLVHINSLLTTVSHREPDLNPDSDLNLNPDPERYLGPNLNLQRLGNQVAELVTVLDSFGAGGAKEANV